MGTGSGTGAEVDPGAGVGTGSGTGVEAGDSCWGRSALDVLASDPGAGCEHYRQYRRLVVLFFLVFSKFLLDISSSRVKRWQTRFILS